MGQAQISPYLFRVKAAFFTLANIFQIAQDQKLRYSASFFTAVYIYIKKKQWAFTVFPLPRTAGKNYESKNCQHQIYEQKATVNTKYHKTIHEKRVSRKGGGGEEGKGTR